MSTEVRVRITPKTMSAPTMAATFAIARRCHILIPCLSRPSGIVAPRTTPVLRRSGPRCALEHPRKVGGIPESRSIGNFRHRDVVLRQQAPGVLQPSPCDRLNAGYAAAMSKGSSKVLRRHAEVGGGGDDPSRDSRPSTGSSVGRHETTGSRSDACRSAHTAWRAGPERSGRDGSSPSIALITPLKPTCSLRSR